ncbi:MAG: maleylpyruvate isomerase N-terminal domain-containing protein [Acidimicrobiia bacterium]
MSEIPRAAKTELTARMDGAFDTLTGVLDTIDESDMVGPTDDEGWTVLDHVVHLCSWAEGIAALLRRESRWDRMGIPEFDPRQNPPGTEFDLDEANATMRQRNQGLTVAEAQQRLQAAHTEVTTAVDALSDDDLNLPYGRFVEPFTEDIGAPVFGRVLRTTAGHYNEHVPWILAILGR